MVEVLHMNKMASDSMPGAETHSMMRFSLSSSPIRLIKSRQSSAPSSNRFPDRTVFEQIMFLLHDF
jgi:hypothetical protein